MVTTQHALNVPVFELGADETPETSAAPILQEEPQRESTLAGPFEQSGLAESAVPNSAVPSSTVLMPASLQLLPMPHSNVAPLAGKWLEDPDLLLRIEDEQAQGESKPAIIVWSVFAVSMLAILGFGVAKAGGLTAVGFAIVASLIFSLIGRAYMKAKRAKNQELWDWWDDRGSTS